MCCCAHKNISSKFWGPSQKNLEPKDLDFSFAILRLYRKCLQNATSYRQSENGIANYSVSLKL